MAELEQQIVDGLKSDDIPILKLAGFIEESYHLAQKSKEVADFVKWYDYQIQLHEKIYRVSGRQHNLLDSMNCRYRLAKTLNQLSNCGDKYVSEIVKWVRALIVGLDIVEMTRKNRKWQSLDNDQVDELSRVRNSFLTIAKMPEIAFCLNDTERDILETWLREVKNLLGSQNHSK